MLSRKCVAVASSSESTERFQLCSNQAVSLESFKCQSKSGERGLLNTDFHITRKVEPLQFSALPRGEQSIHL